MNSQPELRMLRLELQHAISAIERARLLAQDGGLKADLADLLEDARELLDDLIKEKAQ